jgi:hypothetical protein
MRIDVASRAASPYRRQVRAALSGLLSSPGALTPALAATARVDQPLRHRIESAWLPRSHEPTSVK